MGWFWGLRLVWLQSPSNLFVATPVPGPVVFLGTSSAVLSFLQSLIFIFFSDKVFFSAGNGLLILLSCVRVGGGALVLYGAGGVLDDGCIIMTPLFSDVCNVTSLRWSLRWMGSKKATYLLQQENKTNNERLS